MEELSTAGGRGIPDADLTFGFGEGRKGCCASVLSACVSASTPKP